MGRLTPVEQMRQYMNLLNDIAKEEIERTLKYIGESCVAKARDRSGFDSWYDQTGNLRSSIGYAVFEHGVETMRSVFPVVKEGSEGRIAGQNYINELAHKYASTYALVVVAAMNYAEFVEAMDNKDVLASTQLWATGIVDSYLQKTAKRIEKRLNEIIKKDEN